MQIPYQANKATLVEKIAELVEEKVISFGADLVVWFVLTRAYSMMNLRYFEDHDWGIKNFYSYCISQVQVLEGISDIRDESDRTGMRVVIEVCATIFHFFLLCWGYLFWLRLNFL